MQDIKYSVQFNKKNLGLSFEPFETSYAVLVVEDKSDAQKNGVRLGDVITQINDKKVVQDQHPHEVVPTITERPLTMHFVRGETSDSYLRQKEIEMLDLIHHNNAIERQRKKDVQQAQREFEKAKTEKRDAFTAYNQFLSPQNYKTFAFAMRKYDKTQDTLQNTKKLLHEVKTELEEITKKLTLYQEALTQLNTQQNQRLSGAAAAQNNSKTRSTLRF